MNRRAIHLSKRIEAFRDDVVTFVENLSSDDWKKICEWEQWTVGVSARHLGAGHLAISAMLDMIVKGEPLPQLTMDQINAKSNKDAQIHSHCTKAEALDLLQKNGDQLTAFVAGLSDDDLDRKGRTPAFGGEVSTEQLIEYIIFRSGNRHFDNMKNAVFT